MAHQNAVDRHNQIEDHAERNHLGDESHGDDGLRTEKEEVDLHEEGHCILDLGILVGLEEVHLEVSLELTEGDCCSVGCERIMVWERDGLWEETLDRMNCG